MNRERRPSTIEDIFKDDIKEVEVPGQECRLCGSKKIYKYDGVGPLCRKCAYGGPPPVEVNPKHPRNAACPCGSGKKYKKCCLLL